MKKFILISCSLLLAIILTVIGLQMIGGQSQKPPLPSITADGKNVSVFHGSYCWSGPNAGTCVDTVSPPDIIKLHDAAPVKVSPGAILTIEFKDKPLADPDQANLWSEDGPTETVKIDGNKMTAPMEKGVYVYDISARWKEGSGSFVFGIEVE